MRVGFGELLLYQGGHRVEVRVQGLGFRIELWFGGVKVVSGVVQFLSEVLVEVLPDLAFLLSLLLSRSQSS